MVSTHDVLEEVFQERRVQQRLMHAGKFLWTPAENFIQLNGERYSVTNSMKLAVLAEEFGEVAREVCEMLISESKGRDVMSIQKKLRTELIQVAAVAVAWVEGLEKQGIRP